MTWTLRPRAALAGYATGFSAYVSAEAPWADTVSTDLQHYGMKWLFEVANSSAVVKYMAFKMELKYHLEFRDVK